MMHRLHVARLTAIALAACIIVAGGCTERDAASVAADTEKPQDVVETAKQVVAAMKAKDGAGLAEFVPILTLGETNGFCETGGVVQFVMRQRKVRFRINVTAAERAGLKISSRLLDLAEVVRQSP